MLVTHLTFNPAGFPHVDDLHMHKLSSEFADVFAEMPSRLPPKRDVDHAIVMEAGSKPINKAPYGLSRVELEEVVVQVRNCLKRTTSLIALLLCLPSA